MLFLVFICLGCIPWLVHSLAPTDEVSDADLPQSGYLPNHNIQPSIVGSTSFGILWTKTYLPKERWYAKPLVYTPPGQKQLVFTASNQNWIRTVDAVTGAPINARQVQPPFLQSDLGCPDMPDFIGIVGTPVIDPNTDTAYFFAKGYQNNAASGGVAKGTYKFYAVSVLDLTDRPGFPVLIDGHNADNDPARYFIGGTVLQRPSLTLIDGNVYGTFGGHCDLFNYTGMVTAVSTQPGVGVTGMFAMEAAPGAPFTTDIMEQKGGKAGIWMSGMAPATDGARIFVVTGNGQGHENKDTPASGRTPLSTLDEVVANLGIGGGKISLQDYFQPYEYIGMDAADRDLGSGGVALLDPSVFKGTNGVRRIAITIGKNGKAYIMNADNLGGFKMGPGATDNILQTIICPNAVFGGAGSYPLEGGFIYFTPVGFPTLAYKLGLDQKGSPLFSKVGQSIDNSAGRVGVGVPTVTSYKGQPGTGIVWVTDVDGGLKAYKAVPDASGNLIKINIPPTGGLNKFQRPAFGDGRLYVTDGNARVICMGSPVSIPLNCTGPVDFGDVTIGTTKTVQVQCTALIPITKINGLTIQNPTFQASNASLPQGSLAKGATFSFPVVWNLTETSIRDENGASFSSISPGVKTSSLTISTTNGVAQYSNQLPITLQGNEVSDAAFLSLSPPEVDFGGIVVGSPGAATGLDSAFIIANIGSSPLTILGYAYTGTDMDDDDGALTFSNVTQTQGGSKIGDGFTSSALPAVGSVVVAGQSLTVPINFNSAKVGNFQSVFTVWTNGGSKYTLLTGSATTAPIGKLEVETSEGGWDGSGIMDFGTVSAGTTKTRRIRICNVGGSPLTVTKSKPPLQTELLAQNPFADLHEGQSIAQSECAYAPIDIAAAPLAPNNPPHDVSDIWILNTDDQTFGVQEVQIRATIVSRQLGPTYDNGTAMYSYLGCYLDTNPRQLQKQYNLGTANENGICQKTCQDLGYRFAGTEYKVQCWCGNIPPTSSHYTPVSAKKCTYGCAADITQACGGDGAYISIFYDSSLYTPNCGAIPCDGASSSSTSSQVSTTTGTSSTSTSTTVSTTPTSSPTTVRTTSSTTSSSSSGTSSSGTSSSGTSSSTTSLSSSPSSSSTTSSSTSSSSTSITSTTGTSTRTSSTSQTSTSSTSSTASISTTSSTSTRQTSSSTTTSSATSSTSSTASPTSTSGIAGWKSLGCYQDAPTNKAISPYSYRYATDLMTVKLCLDYCMSKGTNYAGIEYHRECYCGNSIASNAIANAPGCTMTCTGNTKEICGGSNRMNVYKAVGSSSSSGTSTSSSTSSSSSSSTSVPSKVVTASTIPSSTSIATTSSSSTSTTTTSSSTTSSSSLTTTTRPSSTLTTLTRPSFSTPTPTKGFLSVGCYAEPPSPSKKPMTQILASDAMSPDLCISALASANSKRALVSSATYAVFGLEYARECWAAATMVQSQTSLVGDQACNLVCKGDTSVKCGGRGMYNYYVATAFLVTGTQTVEGTRTSGVVRATATGTA